MIDHITELEPGKVIRGVKNVAMSEDFLEFHFPRNPIMPGVMLLEALTQLTGWYEAASSDFKSWFLISRVRKSNFYGFAFPGDQVELEVEPIESEDPSVRAYRGRGTVNGKKKIVADFEGTLIPLDEIEDVQGQKRFYQVLRRELKQR
ncbi:MAG: beta-hydroxyacyl-ACP dehydratase [Nitrospira sp.]|nr:beta-hydroxyacyl-ACP dehydratase [Nitrospira sp.]